MKKNLINKFKQRFVLGQAVVFFVLMVAVVSCKDDNLLGIELQPDGQYDTLAFTDSFQVNAFTVPGVRQRSDEAQSYIGRLSTPEFGTTESALIFNLGFNAAYADASLSYADYTLDSVVLHMRPNRVYGEPSGNIPMEIFRLTQTVSADDDNYSDYAPDYNATSVGSWNMSFPRQFNVTDSVSVGAVNEVYQFIIKLDNSIGQELLDMLISVEGLNTSTFQSLFEGFIVKPGSGMDPSQIGAIYSLALRTGESGIRLYLSKDNKQEILKYPINASCARVNQFKHDYSGSLAETYLNEDSKREDLLFVQGLSGLKTQVEVPGLYNFGLKNKIAVAKAVLSFQLAPEQPSELSNSRQMFLLELDEDGTESLTPDYIYSRTRSGGVYDSDTNAYEFDVTRHVQRVLNEAQLESNINYGLRLHAQVPVLNGNDTAHNVISGLDNIVLKLYHTDLKN